eukprot:2487627-Amphidinium_carterae.1
MQQGDKTKWLLEAKASILASTNLPPNHLHDLQRFDVPNFNTDRPASAAQTWAKTIARRRELFQDAVLEIRSPDSSRYYVLHYAMRSPQMLVLSPLVRLEQEWPICQPSTVREHGHGVFEYEFEMQQFHVCTDRDVNAHDDEVYVIPEVSSTSVFTLRGHNTPVHLRAFVMDEPRTKKDTREVAD